MRKFYKALFKNPRAVGAVFPSSKYLANRIAQWIPLEIPGLVVELGAGTGAITKAILQRGIAHHQLIAIESSADLVNNLQEQFPQVQIIHGNADHLSSLLKNIKTPIKAIISSIPLKILPHDIQDHIVKEIESVLMCGGYYIQYTFWSTRDRIENKTQFHKITSIRVWLNFPPAHIDIFQRIQRKN